MRDFGETPAPLAHHTDAGAPDVAACAPPLRGHAGRTVLLVEDEPALRELTGEMLADLAFTVVSAGDADEALRLLREHGVSIDLLVTDVMLPSLTGRELADRVLQINPGIRVLFTSGYTADVIGPRLDSDTSVAMLEKPYTHLTLAAKIERLLG